MRFTKFLKEDIIKTALGIDEPKVKGKYSADSVTRRLETIKKAIAALKGKKADDATEAMMADLEDKQDKWQNLEAETEPAETQDTRPGGEEPAEEEPEEEEPDEKEEPEKEEPEDKKKKKKVPPQFQKKEERFIKSRITFNDFLNENGR